MKNTSGNSITEGVIWKQLLLFFFPILLGTFFQQLYNTVDTIVVGRFVGDLALAAVGGATSVVINLLVGFFTGLATGATVVISQHYGAGDHNNLSRSIHTAAALSLAGGLIITVLGLVFSPMVLVAMNTPADVLPMATQYIQIYFAGSIAVVIYNIGSGIIRALGNSKLPLFFLIVCCLVNIVLDLLFVAVLHWGVMGVAVATLISQVISAGLTVFALCKINPVYGLKFKQIRFHGEILKRIFQIGIPGGLQSVMYSLSNLFIQTCINGFGSATMAMWTAYGKIDAFYWMIVSAFGISITTFVGQNFGARQDKRVKKSIHTCLLLSSGTTVLLVALLYVFGEVLFSVFSANSEIVSQGAYYLKLIAPFYLCFLLVEIFSGAMRGVGDTFVPLMITVFGICVFRVLWAFGVVPLSGDFLTVVVSYPITWTLTGVAFLIYYLRGKWLKKQIALRDGT